MGTGLSSVYTLLCTAVSRKYHAGALMSVVLLAAVLIFLFQHQSLDLLRCAIVGAYAIALNRKLLAHFCIRTEG